MQIITEIDLLERIDTFLARHDMAPTTFGRKATGEPQLISSLRDGRSPSLKVVNKVIEFMARTDEAAATQAKLHAPLELTAAEEVEQPLPFSKAPVNPTGASSPTCSPTPAPLTMPPASGSCPGCSPAAGTAEDDALPNRSCSADADHVAEGGAA